VVVCISLLGDLIGIYFVRFAELSKLFLSSVFLAGCTGSATFENDYFGLVKNSDKFYSHGTSLSYEDRSLLEKKSYTVGQNIYTPSEKRDDANVEVLKRDRPYTGWLYAEYRDTEVINLNEKKTFGIQVGCTGPCSQAKEVQSAVHKLLGQSVPTWNRNFSLKSEPGFILEGERYRLLRESTISNIVVYAKAKVGNIVNSGAFGLDYRLGFNLDRFASESITFKVPEAPRPDWTAYGFIKLEERLVAYNHMLQGSMFQSERHRVTPEPSVQEGNLGVTVGYKQFRVTYRLTGFSSEWKERGGSFIFGGLNLEY
jgi:lipid A 3-O-deacylase